MVTDTSASNRPRDQFGRFTVLAEHEDDNGPQENLRNETETDMPEGGVVETKEEDGITDVRTRDLNAIILSLTSDDIAAITDEALTHLTALLIVRNGNPSVEDQAARVPPVVKNPVLCPDTEISKFQKAINALDLSYLTAKHGPPFLANTSKSVLKAILQGDDFLSLLQDARSCDPNIDIVKVVQLAFVQSMPSPLFGAYLRSFDESPHELISTFRDELPFSNVTLDAEAGNMATVLRNVLTFSAEGYIGVTGFCESNPLVLLDWLLKITIAHVADVSEQISIIHLLVVLKERLSAGISDIVGVDESLVQEVARIVANNDDSMTAVRLFNEFDATLARHFKKSIMKYQFYEQMDDEIISDDVTYTASIFGLKRDTYVVVLRLVGTHLKGRAQITEMLESLGNPRNVPISECTSYAHLYQVTKAKADLLKVVCKLLGGFPGVDNIDAKVVKHLLFAL